MMRRYLRYLRIAWSVGCGIVCLLLIVLWVRSNSKGDAIGGPVSQKLSIEFASVEGYTYVTIWEQSKTAWWYHMYRSGKFYLKTFTKDIPAVMGAKVYEERTPSTLHFRGVAIRDWWLILLGGSIGTLPWLPYSFSLRTLLIATTLVAVLLGLIVYAANK
jgi:hypothetical protein